jgi:hypothetical protein
MHLNGFDRVLEAEIYQKNREIVTAGTFLFS